MEQPRLSTSPPPPRKHPVPVHIGAGLLSRPSTTTGATIQGFVALIPRHIAAARHIPCLACQYLQTSTRSVFGTLSHPSPSVSGALAVLSAFTVDASVVCYCLELEANAPKQCITTRPYSTLRPTTHSVFLNTTLALISISSIARNASRSTLLSLST